MIKCHFAGQSYPLPCNCVHLPLHSLCFRGLIVLNMNDSYYLEPIRGLDSPHHMIYHTKHLEIQGGSCGHGQQTGHSGLFPSLLKPLHQRVSIGSAQSLPAYRTPQLNVLKVII